VVEGVPMEMHFKTNTQGISKELESYASMKLSRLGRYLDNIHSVTVNFLAGNSKKKEAGFRVEIHLIAPGHELHSAAESNSFRAAVDTGVESLKAQLAKFVEKRTTRQRSDAAAAKAVRKVAPRDKPPVPWDNSEHRFSVEHYSLKPMSEQEAVAELKLNKVDVLVFVNQSGAVNAVVRRGRRTVLLQPEPGV
jgi:ribosomal subunit interface protein